MTYVFTCSCGAQVRAPGATPGRVGRCPQCGASLQVPEKDGAIAPEEVLPERAPAPPSRPRPLPKRPLGEPLSQSLAYPFNDASGLALLGLFPPLCLVTSIFSFGLIGYVRSGGDVMALGAMTMMFPAGGLLLLSMSSGLRFLEAVLESSSRGEAEQPKWPSWELAEVVPTLFRWLAGTSWGLVIGGGAAWAYWGSASGAAAGEREGGVALTALALLGLGAFLWPLPLLAVVLHRDIAGANPVMVVGAARACGRSVARIGLLFALSGLAFSVLAYLLYFLPQAGAMAVIGGVWLYWVGFWYVGMVLMRRLGLFYQRNRKRLGWFG